jgi:Ca2+-binding EF-hand superfamily protein
VVSSFKICPGGVLTEYDFQVAYKDLFPKGESENYAHSIFLAFDLNRDSFVCFEVFP